MDLEKLAAAGLYGPTRLTAADRLDLLDYLHDAGATIDEMAVADRDGNLVEPGP